MNRQINIPAELYKDKESCFFAEHYHSTPKNVIQNFLTQEGIIEKTEKNSTTFHLEDNEIGISRGLIDKNHF